MDWAHDQLKFIQCLRWARWAALRLARVPTQRFRQKRIGALSRLNCGAVYYPHLWRFGGKPNVVAQPRASDDHFDSYQARTVANDPRNVGASTGARLGCATRVVRSPGRS